MALDLNSLVNILDKKLLLYRQLLAVSKEEQKAIIHNKPQLIDACVQKKNQLLGLIEKMEKASNKLVAGFARELQIEKQTIQLTDIADSLYGTYKEKVLGFVSSLKSILTELKIITQTNSRLLNYSLNLINCMITNFAPAGDMKCTYTSAGEYQKPSCSSNVEYCF